jgi:hypothetical protein
MLIIIFFIELKLVDIIIFIDFCMPTDSQYII